MFMFLFVFLKNIFHSYCCLFMGNMSFFCDYFKDFCLFLNISINIFPTWGYRKFVIFRLEFLFSFRKFSFIYFFNYYFIFPLPFLLLRWQLQICFLRVSCSFMSFFLLSCLCAFYFILYIFYLPIFFLLSST